jgi:NAD(P)-dependent dehydrogenase (short-subunit alcohol dehydrogenase family)
VGALLEEITMSLTGKTCVVMGGTSGIGLSAAQSLAAAGARVWITGRDDKKLAAARASIEKGVEARVVDGTDGPRVLAFFQEVGAFDHLVLALSGGSGGGPFRALEEAKLSHAFDPKFWDHINGALEAMVAPLALDLAPTRVNAVSPGIIETPWWDKVPEDQRKAVFAASSASNPVRRLGRAEDVADAILFLVCNTFMTGTVIECDGGLRLT